MTFLPSSGSAGHEQLAQPRVELVELGAPSSPISLSRYSRISASDSPSSISRASASSVSVARYCAVGVDDRLQLRQSPARGRGGLLVAGRVELGELDSSFSSSVSRSASRSNTRTSVGEGQTTTGAVQPMRSVNSRRRRARSSRRSRRATGGTRRRRRGRPARGGSRGTRSRPSAAAGGPTSGLRAMTASITGASRFALSRWLLASRSMNSGSTSRRRARGSP